MSKVLRKSYFLLDLVFEMKLGLFLVNLQNQFLFLINIFLKHFLILIMNLIIDRQLTETGHNCIPTALERNHQVIHGKSVIIDKILL